MDYSFISIAVADRTCSGYQLYCGPLDPSAQETSQLNVDEKLSQTNSILVYPKNDYKCTPDFALRTSDVRINHRLRFSDSR